MATSDHKSALRIWRETEGKTQIECAAQLGTSRQVWCAWEKLKRVPNRSFMPKIIALTNGEVTADDFYPQIDKAA